MSASKSNKRQKRRSEKSTQLRKEKQRNILVLSLVAIGLAFLLLQTSKPAEPLASEQVIALGSEIYAQTCATCHGDEGEGHKAILTAPALNGSEHSWHHPDGQIQSLILDGGNLMPALRDQLTDDEVVAVIRFVQTWWSADQLASQQRVSESNPLQ